MLTLFFSKAGDLFSVDDQSIIQDLSEVIHKIREIIHLSEYKRNANDQSVVEICITRVTSAIRYDNHSYSQLYTITLQF